jgi:hypothetical protein
MKGGNVVAAPQVNGINGNSPQNAAYNTQCDNNNLQAALVQGGKNNKYSKKMKGGTVVHPLPFNSAAPQSQTTSSPEATNTAITATANQQHENATYDDVKLASTPKGGSKRYRKRRSHKRRSHGRRTHKRKRNKRKSTRKNKKTKK